MPSFYTLPSGERRTTCPAHRYDGYYLKGDVWVCHGCGEAQDVHESFADTLARKAAV